MAPHIGPEHRETYPGKSEIDRGTEREREREGRSVETSFAPLCVGVNGVELAHYPAQAELPSE